VTTFAKEKSYFPLFLSLCLPHFLIAYPALRSSHIHVGSLGDFGAALSVLLQKDQWQATAIDRSRRFAVLSVSAADL